jgi:hypothetical protein
MRVGYGGPKFPEPWELPKSVRIRVTNEMYALAERYEQNYGRFPY